MNYDKAHDLAHAMRESEEYKELMAAQEAVKADAVATGLVRTFMAQQMQWEYAKLSGAPEADESRSFFVIIRHSKLEDLRTYLLSLLRWQNLVLHFVPFTN